MTYFRFKYIVPTTKYCLFLLYIYSPVLVRFIDFIQYMYYTGESASGNLVVFIIWPKHRVDKKFK